MGDKSFSYNLSLLNYLKYTQIIAYAINAHSTIKPEQHLLRNGQIGRQTDRQAMEQTDRQTGREADRQIGRQAGMETKRQAVNGVRPGRLADKENGRIRPQRQNSRPSKVDP